MSRILLSLAHMGGGEKKYVDHAFETNWIVPLGPNVNLFEDMLADFLGIERGRVVALSAGTAAIHLGLVMLGVSPGDEVICQSFTFSASANPVRYCGANPVFVDSDPETWDLDPEILEQAIIDRHAITGKYPKAIIPVYLYGMPAHIDRILAIAAKYNIPVLEDAAEGLGSEYRGQKCGTFGTYGALSFNGNKIITTSGGGALICPDKQAAERVKFYATQARENRPYYYHKVIGYNYRLSNVSAGIGCGQMEVLPQTSKDAETSTPYTSDCSPTSTASPYTPTPPKTSTATTGSPPYCSTPTSSPSPPTNSVKHSTPPTSKADCYGDPCTPSPYTKTRHTTAAQYAPTPSIADYASPAAHPSPTTTSTAYAKQYAKQYGTEHSPPVKNHAVTDTDRH